MSSFILLFFFNPMPLIMFIIYGTYSGWFYLRFIHKNKDSHLRGDPSPDFSLASFFPMFLTPLVSFIASVSSKIFRLHAQHPVTIVRDPYNMGIHPLSVNANLNPNDSARRK